jgi:hypothetical protein
MNSKDSRVDRIWYFNRRRVRHQKIWMLVYLLFFFGVSPLVACKLPVFRYALERWPVDQYRIVAMVGDSDSPDVQDAIEALKRCRSTGHLNAEIEVVNLAELTDEQWWQYEGLEGGSKNQLQVYYPTSGQKSRLGWTGDLTCESIERWISSPLRDSLMSDLSTGVSAVWLLVEGDDLESNDQLEKDLLRALTQANQTIAIPDGVINPSQAADYFRDNPGASMDDVLRCSIPLRVDFRLRRVDQDDPQEAAMVAMLRTLGVRPQQAFLVPVFGRGRMLDAIPTDPFDPDVVLKACQYMVGECSCTVKAQNPGVDLLLNVDWKLRLGAETLVVGANQLSSPIMLAVPDGKQSGSWGEEQSQRQESNSLVTETQVFSRNQKTRGNEWPRWLIAVAGFIFVGLVVRKLVRR